MNEMRKLMESIEQLEEAADPNIVVELEGLLAEIKSMVWEAKDLVRAGFGGNSVGYERAKYWIAAIETALDKDHDWLGGNMFTMEDTIQELKGAPDAHDEYDEEDEL
jgi:hypothetical protein